VLAPVVAPCKLKLPAANAPRLTLMLWNVPPISDRESALLTVQFSPTPSNAPPGVPFVKGAAQPSLVTWRQVFMSRPYASAVAVAANPDDLLPPTAVAPAPMHPTHNPLGSVRLVGLS
jgi:hypothetical protein